MIEDLINDYEVIEKNIYVQGKDSDSEVEDKPVGKGRGRGRGRKRTSDNQVKMFKMLVKM